MSQSQSFTELSQFINPPLSQIINIAGLTDLDQLHVGRQVLVVDTHAFGRKIHLQPCTVLKTTKTQLVTKTEAEDGHEIETRWMAGSLPMIVQVGNKENRPQLIDPSNPYIKLLQAARATYKKLQKASNELFIQTEDMAKSIMAQTEFPVAIPDISTAEVKQLQTELLDIVVQMDTLTEK